MNQDVRNLTMEDFTYPLPDERIARYPLPERDSSKLLLCRHGAISEDRFYNLPDYLPSGALMVFNNTRVIRARLHFRKPSGALIEVFCLEPIAPREYATLFATTSTCTWLCLVGNLKKWKEGPLTRTFDIDGRAVTLTVNRAPVDAEAIPSASFPVIFSWDVPVSFAELLEAAGELPIPPYLGRETEESDLRTYQTVYSKIEGSVAAPTAGLHFTPRVLADIDARCIIRDEVTLHVGAGTFRPVKAPRIEGHEMHAEYILVHRHTIDHLLAHDGHAIAVGTTSVRTLESLYYIGLLMLRNPSISEDEISVPQWMPYDEDARAAQPGAEPLPSTVEALTAIRDWLDRNGLEALHTTTRIIIAPSYKWHVVSAIVTNFHQPGSTLLLLVAALIGDTWHEVYRYALDHEFRFLSYGDSSLLIP